LNKSSAVAEMDDGMQCGQYCHCQPCF